MNENSVINAVNTVRNQRENQEIESAPILITQEFANLLSQFHSIAINQRMSGLQGLRDYSQCMLCLSKMTS